MLLYRQVIEIFLTKRIFTMDNFIKAYVAAALWSSNDESDEAGGVAMDKNYTIEDISASTMTVIIKDCQRFQSENRELLFQSGLTDEQAGHDFWLTRCGHGTGFWDRDIGDFGDKLTKSCKKFGNVELYVGDDGLINHI
jgi:hypothetical protein